jgi:hypothetical protein
MSAANRQAGAQTRAPGRAVGAPSLPAWEPGRRSRPTWMPTVLIVSGALAAACLVGALVPLLGARLSLLGLAGLALIAAVALHSPLGAYLLIGITPLVAGIDRGSLIPVLRPNEALALVVAAGLVARGLLGLRSGSVPRFRIGRIDASILLMAVVSSIIPLVWMLLRGQSPVQDDLLYALIIWKYYAIYLLVRFSVRTEHQVRSCLWIAMISASIVAVIAMLQSLQLFGITRILSTLYAPYGNVNALLQSRGGSTLSLPIAEADLMIFSLAIVAGLLASGSAHRRLLIGLGILCLAGVVAAGEFSGVIGLIIGLVTMAVVLQRVRPLAGFVPAALGAAVAFRPVIDRRLSGFSSASGLPVSWAGRLHNLQNYFWPQLFSHGNFILGVRPAARVATRTMATGFIWIESGYTWLLWSGGIPFLLSFLFFFWTSLRRCGALARSRADAFGVAGLAVVVALVVIGILMILDPHLTYRGSADLLFALLALSSRGMGSDADGVVGKTKTWSA